MNLARFPKTAAILLTLLMAAPLSPLADAQLTLPQIPVLPGSLPTPGPGARCVDTLLTDQAAMAEANRLAGSPGTYFADHGGRFVVCDTNEQALVAYSLLENNAKLVFDNYTATLALLQHQADERANATFPGGDLLQPEITLLADDFQGHRKAGVGEWSVVTDHGEPAAWRTETLQDLNGTLGAYRFGTDAGYEAGIHQWLVSPMIDMGAAFANRDLFASAFGAENLAIGQLRAICSRGGDQNSFGFNGGGVGSPPTSADPNAVRTWVTQTTAPYLGLAQDAAPAACGSNGLIDAAGRFGGFVGVTPADRRLTDLVLTAYEQQVRAATRAVPFVHRAATLAIDYRFNLANMTDGVRPWLYVGDRAPDQRILSDPAFGAYTSSYRKANERCQTDTVTDNVGQNQRDAASSSPELRSAQCRGDPQGGTPLGQVYVASNPRNQNEGFNEPTDGMADTAQFHAGPRGDAAYAFTGSHLAPGHAVFDLTNYTGLKVWFLLEVRTEPDTGRGGNNFADTGRFPQAGAYGFQLLGINATAQAYYRDVRLEPIGQELPLIAEGNPFDDDVDHVRLAAPGENLTLLVPVFNGGTQVERAHVDLDLARGANAASLGSAGRLYSGLLVDALQPGEVRVLRLTVPAASVVDGLLHNLTATLSVDDLPSTGNVTSLNSTRTTDPAATQVRVPNAPGAPTVQSVDVRAYVRHALSAVRAKGTGAPLEVCSQIHELNCVDSFAAKKGDPRILQIAVRNEGSAIEDVTASLELSLDGVSRASSAVDGTERTLAGMLPGETRVVTFTVQPGEPGIWRASVVFHTATGASANATRPLYVQRNAGMLCFDDMGENRECAAGFVLSQPDALKGYDVAAALADGDGLLVATRQGAVFRRGADGSFDPTPVANLSPATLASFQLRAPAPGVGFGALRAATRAPDGAAWFVGDNATVVRLAGSDLATVTLNATRANLTGAAWFDGTLWASGSNGTLLWWNQSSNTMERFAPFTLYDPVTATSSDYVGPLDALAVANGSLYVAGGSGHFWILNATRVATAASTGTNARLYALGVHDGLVYAVGGAGIRVTQVDGANVLDGKVVLRQRAPGSATFLRFAAPALPLDEPRPAPYAQVFWTPDGALWAADANGNLTTCSACADLASPGWTYPRVPQPMVGATPGLLRASVATPTSTTLLGQGGYVLDYAPGLLNVSNAGDWTVFPGLYGEEGVIEFGSAVGAAQAYRVSLNAPVTGFRQFRVTLDHHVLAANGANKAEAFVRLVESQTAQAAYPSSEVSEGNLYVPTCGRPAPDMSATTLVGSPSTNSPGQYLVGTACHANGSAVGLGSLFLQDAARFGAPTASSGWERVRVDNLAPPFSTSPGGGYYVGFELYGEPNVRWAVDRVVVEGYNGSASCPGGWCVVQVWNGPNAPSNTPSVARVATGAVGSGTLPAGNDVTARDPAWYPRAVAFGFSTTSLWHVTTKTDRPVWVANDEMLGAAFHGAANASGDHLRDNFNSRLVTPVLDLANAFDPVVTFRHAYAFRSLTFYRTDETTGEPQNQIEVGDAGWIEVQYLRQGPDECPPPATSETTCGWSDFYKIKPEGGYPTLAQLGAPEFGGTNAAANFRINADDQDEAGPVANLDPGKGSLSYWFRNVRTNAEGQLPDLLDTSNYQTASVRLNEVGCEPGLEDAAGTYFDRYDCVPLNLRHEKVKLGGHQVRLGFHIRTPDSALRDPYFEVEAQDPGVVPVPSSYAGEGWYITDLKVEGAKKLGINLVASDLRFAVGYDADRLGVGPGTRVPVNVTVTNAGEFDALGYTGSLEVRRIIDPVARTSTLVQTIPLAQQPLLEAGRSVNHTFYWDVPATEEAKYALTVTITPIGIDRDEDPIDNVLRLGTFVVPVVAHSRPEYHVDLVVSPENATSEIARYVPLFVVNTGNVPLAGFTLTRTITLQAAAASRVVDERTFATTQPVGPGTRASLAAIADVNPADDLYWQPPEKASYLIAASATVDAYGQTLRSGAEKRVAAFATFLFDDVEGGVRGDVARGDWKSDAAWSDVQPGFRSTDAYAFGDPATGHYPDGADASLATPTLDLSAARSARIAFYHRYRFEPSFDAGAVEISSDGGRTWTALAPSADDVNGLPTGYITDAPLAASNPIHPTGNPENVTYAFSGDSSTLPVNLDGWVLSQYDLTRFANITQQKAAYEFYRNPELAGYASDATNATLKGARKDPAIYTSQSWRVGGSEDDLRYWEVQNLTERGGAKADDVGTHGVVSPIGSKTFWWSGSASLEDDGQFPDSNPALNIKLDLTKETSSLLVMDWWEWADLFGQSAIYMTKDAPHAPKESYVDSYIYTDGMSNGGQTYRYNVTNPRIVEQQGKWIHYQAQLPESARKGAYNVTFVYAPVVTNKTAELNGAGATMATRKAMFGKYVDDRGWAIDGFRVVGYNLVNGRVADLKVVKSTDDAWKDAKQFGCAPFANTGGNSERLPCFDAPGSSVATAKPAHLPYVTLNTQSKWRLVDHLAPLPGAWSVVPVQDAQGRGGTNGTTTSLGESPLAWYTGFPGDPLCRDSSTNARKMLATDHPCPLPGSESRLVTPVIDLSKIAGDRAYLTFDHRYAFEYTTRGSWDYPLGGGGVVEVQTFDTATGQWGPWTQIYARPDAMTPYPVDGAGNRDTSLAAPNAAHNGETKGMRGGYSAFTVNASPKQGGFALGDAPFAPVAPGAARNQVPVDVQYFYSGKSTDVEGQKNGWINASYDLKPFVGQKVRFGFHVAFDANRYYNQMNAVLRAYDGTAPGHLAGPDGPGDAPAGGWWIANLSVSADVLAASPVQLRFHAATDGNVHDGFWQIDDVGVFGARYGRNVGLFTESSDAGALRGDNATVRIVVRNLGDTVRRGLAVNASLPSADFGVDLQALDAASGEALQRGVRLYVPSLAPGQSANLTLRVHVPDSFPRPTGDAPIVLKLEEYNPTVGAYAQISDNEVQGFLRRIVDFHVRSHGSLEAGATTTSVVPAKLGEPVSLGVELRNTGYAAQTVSLTCSAQTVDSYTPTKKPDQDPVVTRATYPWCGNRTLSLPVGGRATATFDVTPTAAGTLVMRIVGTVADGTQDGYALDAIVRNVAVEVPTLARSDNFTLATSVRQAQGGPGASTDSWGGSAQWHATRGHDGAGSLILGVPDVVPTYPGGSVYVATSPVIDLHNYSAQQPAFLTFWHQDRMAKGDGADVSARVLLDETSNNGWAPGACRLEPIGGYEGNVSEFRYTPGPNGEPPGDHNPAFDVPGNVGAQTFGDGGTYNWSARKYFVSGTWEDGWTKAVFDLSRQGCVTPTGAPLNLTGYKVQFLVQMWTGLNTPGIPHERGPGQGFLIDDVSLGPYNLDVRPQSQRAVLLDNVTKSFNVLVTNGGSMPDLVRLESDDANASAPPGSIVPPTGAMVLQPGETRLVPVAVVLPRDPGLLPTTYHAVVRAVSLLDAHVGESTAIDLVFAPRQLADLGLTVQLPTGSVQEGTESFIPITVENHGLATSLPSRLHVSDLWVQGGTRVESDLELPAVASFFLKPEESSRVIEYHWRPAKGTLGEHVLTFTADPDVLGEEYLRSDNVLVARVNVSALLIPDLDVGNASAVRVRDAGGNVVEPTHDADVTRYEITAGELAGFELKVRNTGRAAATNVDVRASVGSLTLPAKTVPYIPPGGQVLVTFNWLAQKGDYNLTFDVRNEQLQLATDNDHYPLKGVTLLTVKGYEIGIDLPALDGALEPGSDLRLAFNVTNAGNAGEDVNLVAKAPAGVRVELARSALFVRPGETVPLVAKVHVGDDAVAGTPEPQFIRVLAVSRENPMKVASGQTQLSVRPEYGGSVPASVVAAAPPTFVLPILARNEGNSLEPWTIRVALPAGWSAAQTLPAKLVVPPRSQAQLDLSVTMPTGTAPGPRVVNVEATLPDGTVRTGQVTVGVLPVRGASATLVEDAGRAAEGALAFPVTVENTGNLQAPFEVLLTRVPPGVEANLAPSTFDLAPGAKAVATLTVKPNASVQAGTYAVGTYALFAGVVPDSAEGRANQQALKVSLVRPDLAEGTLEYAPRQGLSAGDRVSVRVPVTNHGSAPAADVPVHLFVDDVFVAETRLATLAPGEKAEVAFNWTALPGRHTLTAVADPYNDTVDPVREDNAVSGLVDVGVAGAAGGLAAQRGTPGFEWLVALAALALCALAIPRLGSRRP